MSRCTSHSHILSEIDQHIASSGRRMLDSRASLGASMFSRDSDYELRDSTPGLNAPSYRSSPMRSEFESEAESESPWSPPGWRKSASGLYAPRYTQSPSWSRGPSPMFESAQEYNEYDIARRVPLPDPRDTPYQTPPPDVRRARFMSPIPEDTYPEGKRRKEDVSEMPQRGYIRVRIDSVQYNDAALALLDWFRLRWNRMFHSWTSTLFTLSTIVVTWIAISNLFTPAPPQAGPDLVGVASVAKSMDALITYSELGREQVYDLDATSTAVTDLAESVRYTSMDSAQQMYGAMETLGSSLDKLSVELRSFHSEVSGGVDAVVQAMEWSRRELSHHVHAPPTGMGLALANVQAGIERLGLLESSEGKPNAIGNVVMTVLGPSQDQVGKRAVLRAFHELLNVFEEVVDQQVQHASELLQLFDAIDQQFSNIQRMVAREQDSQDNEEGQVLASLWTSLVGTNTSKLKKFAKNRELLSSLLDRTRWNRNNIKDHKGQLDSVKARLQQLRKRLVSPLVSGNTTSHLSIEQQILGIAPVEEHLKSFREMQRIKADERYQEFKAGKTRVYRENPREIESARQR